MEKKSSSLILLVLLMLSGYVPTIAAFPPTGYDPTHLIIDSISEPETLDPAWCYDTASAGIIFNVYETVIFFETVHTDFAWGPFQDGPYAAGKTHVSKPQLATDISITSGPDPYVKTFYFKIRGSSTTHTFEASIDVNLLKDGQIYDGTYAVRDPEYGVVGKIQGPIRPATEVPSIDGYVDRFQVSANVYAGGSPMGTTWERGDGPAGTRGCVIRSWSDVDASWDLSVGDGLNVVRKCFNHPNGPHWNARNYYTVLSVDPGPPYIITAIEDLVYFHDGVSTLTPADVEYSWERWMVQDRFGGPTWMIYYPVLGVYGAVDPGTDPNFGDQINNAVGSNATHAWISLSTDFPDTAFLQIMSQSWASIVNKDWCVALGDFDGDWTHTWEYIYNTWHDPPASFIGYDMMGTGPYEFDYWVYGAGWSIVKFDDYWDGWPAHNSPTGTRRLPGYISRVTLGLWVSWITRRARFFAGDSDYTYVPRPYRDQVLGQEVCGEPIRCYYPFPMLALDAMFFTFNISTISPYLGPGFDPSDPYIIAQDRIPINLFSDINVRLGFAYAFDYNTYIATPYLGEGTQPPTYHIPQLPYCNPNQWSYKYSLKMAEACLKLAWGGSWSAPLFSGTAASGSSATLVDPALPGGFVCDFVHFTTGSNSGQFRHITVSSPGSIMFEPDLPNEVAAGDQYEIRSTPNPGALWNSGMTFTIVYNDGNVARETSANMIANAINSLNNEWDVNEPAIRDNNNNGVYDAGDTVLCGSPPAIDTVLSFPDDLERYADTNVNSEWNVGEPAIRDNNNNGVYDAGDTVLCGSPPTLGTVLRVPDDFEKFADVNTSTSMFHLSTLAVAWGSTYLPQMVAGMLPLFISGWTADYADPDDFVRPFMHSQGIFPRIQRIPLVSALVDQLIEAGALLLDDTNPYNGELDHPDPRPYFNNWPNIPPDIRWPKRSIYYWLQWLYYENAASVPLIQPIGRHWEQHWMRGWYYSPLYGGSLASAIDSTAPEAPVTYFYHIWKALTHFGDANNDGYVDILDGAIVSASWTKPDPTSVLGPVGYLVQADMNGGTGGVPGGGSGFVIGMPDGKVGVVDSALVSAYWD